MLVERRLRFAGHCWRSVEPVKDLLFASHPSRLQTKVGRPPLTYPKMLSKDTGLEENALKQKMEDRAEWNALVQSVVGKIKMDAADPVAVVRTSIHTPGTGRGRHRLPDEQLTAEARRMRFVNANKKMVQLVCVVCRTKGCNAHCQACEQPHDHHQPPNYVKCVCCDRTTSAACLSSNIQDMDCFLCNDCHVLTDDM
eukprot:TRINITY_DN5292_c0_g1_i2.p1 TRINITY_DN5292_c0_g1~~TRINITY_DN5292_c0_g1_i2.p1  ORF type:complete len:197 (+),score=45.99 TRINITY_DN5292_c0_g1_i2:116-706(+)